MSKTLASPAGGDSTDRQLLTLGGGDAKRVPVVVGLLIFICSLSLLLVSGQATGQTTRSDATMSDILAEETAESKKEFVAMKKAAAVKKAAEEKAAKEKITK